MDLKWKQIRHFLNEPFKIAHGSYEYRDSYILSLTSNDRIGYGEVSVVPYYVDNIEEIDDAFKEASRWIKDLSPKDPRNYWDDLRDICKGNTWAISAIDCALWDVYGKSINKRVVDILYPHVDLNSLPLSSITIGGGTIEQMKKRIEGNPWPIYKIKLGMENDLEVIKSLREATDSTFRVDANAGLDVVDACKWIHELLDLNVEILEQPFHPDMDGFMPQIHYHGGPVLIADESCQNIEDMNDCVGLFHGVNIKLSKAGGITAAMEMIKKADDLSLQTMIGCMTESSVGISAAAALLPGVQYADIDGAILLREDIASGVVIEEGKPYLPKSNGLGISLHGKIF